MQLETTNPLWPILLDNFTNADLANMLTLDKKTSEAVINILAQRKWQNILKYKPKSLTISNWINLVKEAMEKPFPPEWACKTGQIDILEFLWKTENFSTENWSKFAASYGQIGVLKWMIKNKIKINPQTVYIANLWGQKQVADFLKILD